MPEWIAKYWLEWLFGVLIAVLTLVVRTLSARIKKQAEENKALRDGMRSLLRAQIIDTCERMMADQWCGARMRDTINDLYNSYHALGGNGTVTSIVSQVMDLPAYKQEAKNHEN